VWKNKKVVLLAALAVAVLIGSIAAGVAFAQSGSGNETQTNTRYEALLNKVATIYQQNTGVTIDPQQLETAFTQAQNEMQNEALQSWLQNLVSKGTITQQQADQYLQWQQSKPDIPLLEPHGGGNMIMLGRGHNCWGGNETIPQIPGS
jgi:ABC-type glycerol-3-phosphate transport system substrate-binding protein